jgi:hypothetical protein
MYAAAMPKMHVIKKCIKVLEDEDLYWKNHRGIFDSDYSPVKEESATTFRENLPHAALCNRFTHFWISVLWYFHHR